MVNNTILDQLHISTNGGTTIVNRNVPTAEGQDPLAGMRPRFDQVHGVGLLSVGSDHPIYGNPTSLSYDPRKDPDVNPAEGIVTRNGNTQGDLTDEKSLLRINGMEMDMPTAMKHGLIQKTAVGYILSDKAQDIMGKNAENAQAYQAQNVQVVDTRARSAGLTRLEQAVGGQAVHSLLTGVIGAATDGVPLRDRSAIETAAKASGMSVDQVLKTFSSAMEASEIRAKAALSKAGYDGEGAMEHLWNNVETTTRNSILAGLVAGDASALNYLAQLHRTGDKR